MKNIPNSETPTRVVVLVTDAFTFGKAKDGHFVGSVYNMQNRRYAVKWPAGQKFITNVSCMHGTILILERCQEFDTQYSWVVLPYDDIQVEK